MLFIVNRAGGGSILHNVTVSVRDHYDVARLEAQAVAAVQSHRGAPFGEQVIDDHMLAFSLKVARQCVGTGGINTPGGGKLAAVKQRSLKPNHSQYFGKHVHRTFRQASPGLLSNSSYGNSAASKKGGRRDKYAVASRAIVGNEDSRERTRLRRRHGYDDLIGDG